MASKKSNISVNYEEFFEFPVNPLNNDQCIAKCKTCGKSNKYSLNTKANLLHHLEATHSELLKQYLEKRSTTQSTQLVFQKDTGTLNIQPFRKQEQINKAIIQHLICK